MRKSILVAVFILLIGTGVYFFIASDSDSSEQAVVQNAEQSRRFVSDFGFSFELPSTWKVMEGESAGMYLLLEDPKFEKIYDAGGLDQMTLEDIKYYQSVLDKWKIDSATTISFSNSNSFDYENRNFSYVGELLSRSVEKTVKNGVITIGMDIIFHELSDFSLHEDERWEQEYVDFNGLRSIVTVGRYQNGPLDLIHILVPLRENVMDDKATHIIFTSHVLEDDKDTYSTVINFVKGLNIQLEE